MELTMSMSRPLKAGKVELDWKGDSGGERFQLIGTVTETSTSIVQLPGTLLVAPIPLARRNRASENLGGLI
jgi:hypothetical protein